MSNKVKDNREEQRIADEAWNYNNSIAVPEQCKNEPYKSLVFGIRNSAYIVGAMVEANKRKEDSIAFAEWLVKRNVEVIGGGYWNDFGQAQDLGGNVGVAPVLTTEQLYEIYINQKV